MKKKAKCSNESKLAARETIELKRWCIGEAIRWPNERDYGAANYGGFPRPVSEPDIISRAEKILKWVTA